MFCKSVSSIRIIQHLLSKFKPLHLVDCGAVATILKGGDTLSGKQKKSETSRKLKKLMKKKGVTCYKVAQDLDISQTAVHDWVNGEYEPKLNNLKKLSSYFEVPLEHFIK